MGGEGKAKCIYQLYGLSVHHGGMSGGHYIAYAHKNRAEGPKKGWFYFSDSACKAVEFKDAMRAQAYVLFYQRVDRVACGKGKDDAQDVEQEGSEDGQEDAEEDEDVDCDENDSE